MCKEEISAVQSPGLVETMEKDFFSRYNRRGHQISKEIDLLSLIDQQLIETDELPSDQTCYLLMNEKVFLPVRSEMTFGDWKIIKSSRACCSCESGYSLLPGTTDSSKDIFCKNGCLSYVSVLRNGGSLSKEHVSLVTDNGIIPFYAENEAFKTFDECIFINCQGAERESSPKSCDNTGLLELVSTRMQFESDIEGMLCKDCKYSVGHVDAFYSHICIEHEIVLKNCEACITGFSDTDTLEEHLVSHLIAPVENKPNLQSKQHFIPVTSRTKDSHPCYSDSPFYSVLPVDPTVLKHSQSTLHYYQRSGHLSDRYYSKSDSEDTSKSVFTCPFCQMRHSCKREVREHVQRHHQLDDYHQCLLCFQRFPLENHLQRHVNRAHNHLDPNTCLYCKDILKDQSMLQHHMYYDYNKQQMACRGPLKKLEEPQIPVPTKVNYAEVNGSPPGVSDVVYASPVVKNASDSSFKIPQDPQFIGDNESVPESTTTPGAERKQTRTPRLPPPCPVCGLQLRSRLTFNGHKKKHEEFDPHTCVICKTILPTMNELISHMNIHNTEGKFSCHICPREFITEPGLIKHLETGHRKKEPKKEVRKEPKNVKDYVCRLCNKGYKSVKELDHHLQTYLHADSLDDISDKVEEVGATTNGWHQETWS